MQSSVIVILKSGAEAEGCHYSNLYETLYLWSFILIQCFGTYFKPASWV